MSGLKELIHSSWFIVQNEVKLLVRSLFSECQGRGGWRGGGRIATLRTFKQPSNLTLTLEGSLLGGLYCSDLLRHL